MLVVVASRNPVKIAAVEKTFEEVFRDSEIQLDSVAVSSGVADQPVGDEATLRGARNRAIEAASIHPDAEYCVGLEGGVETVDRRLLAFAWIAVRARDGRTSEARSVTLPLPDAVRELVRDGLELGDANDQVFATANSKQKGGAFGLLTDGRYTRESIYAQTLSMALIPFVHELFTVLPDEQPDR